MSTPYTARDFERVARKFAEKDYLFRNVFGESGGATAMTAFRIAAAVVRPGVLGEVVMKQLGPSAAPAWIEATVNAIRAALLKDADNG